MNIIQVELVIIILINVQASPTGGFVVLGVALRLFGSVISAAFRCMINTPPNVYISV